MTEAAAPAPRAVPPLPMRVARFLGSYALGMTILLLLFLVVLVGTLEQRHMSLYDVQRTYFESLYFTVGLFDGKVPLPLPGGGLLIGALLANLTFAALLWFLRRRLRASTLGILITHGGIVLLLVGSGIEYASSDKGYMQLYEGQSSGVFRSYADWEIALREAPGRGAREFVLPPLSSEHDASDRVVHAHPDLPFDIEVEGWVRNADAPDRAASGEGAEGYRIVARAPEREAEANTPAAYVTLRPRDGTAGPRGLLWGAVPDAPWVAVVAGKAWEVELRRRQWQVPFEIRLDDFVKVDHPGTMMAKEYSSYVTKQEDGAERRIHITMNQPLRYKGFTFYQSSYRDAQFPAPRGWRSIAAEAGMLRAWRVGATRGTEVVVAGAAGTPLEEANRWRARMGLAAATAGEMGRAQRQGFLGQLATVVELEGAWAPVGEGAPLAGAKLLGVVAPMPSRDGKVRVVSARLVGPAAAVDRERGAFLEFVGRSAPNSSTFSVVRNPTDRMPLISCIVIALGLLLHFGVRLVRYLQRESPRTARTEVPA